jgi:hypothetical protein
MSQETRQQYEDRIAGYIAKGVSGGKDGNPPDRYIEIPITEDILAAINAKADEGYRIAGTIPGYVLMGNYKENK